MLTYKKFEKQFLGNIASMTSADIINELEDLGLEFDDIKEDKPETAKPIVMQDERSSYNSNDSNIYSLAA